MSSLESTPPRGQSSAAAPGHEHAAPDAAARDPLPPAVGGEGLAADWRRFSPVDRPAVSCRTWRGYCDRLHGRLLDRWLGPRRFAAALKTDLFDEAVGEGCVAALASRAAAVHGIDMAHEIVEAARRRHPGIAATTGDVRSLPFASGRFDLVFSNSTLDHFASVAEIHCALAEVSRVLAPGGVLLLTLDNPWNPVLALRSVVPQRLAHRLGLIPYFMGKTLSRRRLAAAVAEHGLRVTRVGFFMHAPRVIALHLCRLADAIGVPARPAVAAMLATEILAALPTATITGHYSAITAVKP